MSVEKVKAYFRARGMEGRIRELEASSATVALAAQVLASATVTTVTSALVKP